MIDFLSVGAGFRSFKPFSNQRLRFQIHAVGTELLYALLLLGVQDGGKNAYANQSTQNQDSTFHGKPFAKNGNGGRNY